MKTSRFFITYLDPKGREKVYHLREALVVGRASDCHLCLSGEGISRRHCRFRLSGGAVVVEDLDSTNGTFLNGRRVQKAVAHAGDRITVGSCTLRLGESEEGETAVEAGRTQHLGGTTIRMILRAGEDTPPDGDALRRTGLDRDHLETLFHLTELVTAARDLETLYRGALELFMDLFGMDLGCVIEGGTETVPPEPRVTVDRAGRPGYGPSRSVLRKVIEENVSVTAADAISNAALFEAPSLAEPGTVSIMCVPVRAAGEVRGAVYLSSLKQKTPENPEALRLLVSMVTHLGLAGENLRYLHRLERENLALRTALPGPGRLVGASRSMEAVRRLVAKVAPTDATVLIVGESGTGKELAAAAVHEASARRERPMVCINCGAIPEGMVESELFGHERGAFTGAEARRPGKFELASEGTLFLDEVGELPPATQVKLLRALEQQRFFRVGGSEPVEVNVRIVAATNADLERKVDSGAFRRDLYYRLKVFQIHLPPLRERLEDLPELVEVLLDRIPGGRGFRVGEEGLARLRAYPWPGNVRELRNVLEREVILAEGAELFFRDLLPAPGAEAAAPGVTLREVERAHLLRVLRSVGWNKKAAAEILGIGRATVYDKMKQHGIREGD